MIPSFIPVSPVRRDRRAHVSSGPGHGPSLRRRLVVSLLRGDQRELDLEDGTVTGARDDLELAAMALDDAVGEREAETRALAHLLRREEGIEDAGPDRLRDAGTGVLELDPHAVGGGLGPDEDPPPVLERVA